MRLWVAEEVKGADSCADGERSRRGAGLPLPALSGATGEADEGRMCWDLRGVGGLAEPERVRVAMADLSWGIDDLGLLVGGTDSSDAGVDALSDMVKEEGGGESRTGEGKEAGGVVACLLRGASDSCERCPDMQCVLMSGSWSAGVHVLRAYCLLCEPSHDSYGGR